MTEPTFEPGLCETHAAEWSAWSDYRRTVPLRINSGASYDDSARGVLARRKRSVEEWLQTIRFQQNLIRRICATRCASNAVAPLMEIDGDAA